MVLSNIMGTINFKEQTRPVCLPFFQGPSPLWCSPHHGQPCVLVTHLVSIIRIFLLWGQDQKNLPICVQ